MKYTLSNEQLEIELLNMFEAGVTDGGKLWQVLSGKFKLSQNRYYEFYSKVLKKWYEIKTPIIEKAIQENVEKSLTAAYLTKTEALGILADIARGKPYIFEDDILLPSFSDRRAAIDTIAKIEGWFAAAKIDLNPVENEQPILVIDFNQKIKESEADLLDDDDTELLNFNENV